MRKSFRFILLPFSLLYGGIISLRNKLFDKKILRSATFDFPLICIGNLSVGGTGKTPMVEYIIRLLKGKYKVATLSRGYKRKTKGFAIAGENSSASDIGDEPMQIHKKFPDLTVSVAEERIMGIPQLLTERPQTEVIVLDDAFQHREVKAGLNILLTDFHNMYSQDLMLPAGNLRDNKKSSKRADIIVVTKCSSNLTEELKEGVIRELNTLPHQKIYFASIKYERPIQLFTGEQLSLEQGCHVLLVCGIANPQPIKEFLKIHVSGFELLQFKDHHIFNSDDISEIKNRFLKIKNESKIILTTEKDGVRISKFEKELKDIPVYLLPMSHQFLFNGEAEFEKNILEFINSFKEDSDRNN
ncbi:MAG: tetraacyldisaccharide 4'-kinase [Ginsengibacter sp.]